MSSFRTQGRRLAVQVLYAIEFGSTALNDFPDLLASIGKEVPNEVRKFALELIHGVLNAKEILDEKLASATENWGMDRIHPIEKSILRIGLYELLFRPDIPADVTVNEAIELARRFGDEEAWRLINGILDHLGGQRLSKRSTSLADDLSKIHEMVGALFPNPRKPQDYKKFELSQDQVEFYHEHGYLAGIRILSEKQIEKLREELEGLFDPNHPGHSLFYEYHSNESSTPGTILFHALGSWRITPGFHDLLWHPSITVPSSQLLGGAVRFWHDQLFCKPPYHGGVVAWHQDYSYWTRTKPLGHLTCWIGLDDSTTENGCLHYIPGSHRWDLLPVTGLTGDMTAIQSVLSEEQKKQFHPIAVELKAGECSFHHPLMVHGSYENRTSIPRRAVVLNFFVDGTLSDSDEEILKGVPIIPRGMKMEGQFFPLLYDPSSIS